MNKRQAKKKIKKYHDRLFRDGVSTIFIGHGPNDVKVNKILMVDADGTAYHLEVMFNSMDISPSLARTPSIQLNGDLLKMWTKEG